MFEHFGIKDAFVAIWKYKIRIIVVAVLFAIVIVGMMSLISVKQKPQALGGGVVQTEQEILLYKKQLDFYLDYSGSDTALSSKTLATMYLNSLSKADCHQYIANYVLERMSKEEIIQRLDATFTPDSITSSFFYQYIRHTIDTTGQAISLWSQSLDEEYSALILEAYKSWFDKLNSAENSQVKMVIMSETKEVVNIPPLVEETLAEKVQLSVEKVGILAFVGALFVGMIVAMGLMLFNPTLNRKNDYENIGIEVLGQIEIPKGV